MSQTLKDIPNLTVFSNTMQDYFYYLTLALWLAGRQRQWMEPLSG
jgi:hypothetical protein